MNNKMGFIRTNCCNRLYVVAVCVITLLYSISTKTTTSTVVVWCFPSSNNLRRMPIQQHILSFISSSKSLRMHKTQQQRQHQRMIPLLSSSSSTPEDSSSTSLPFSEASTAPIAKTTSTEPVTTTTSPNSDSKTKKKKSLWPKVGDIVRYYDLDGGKQKGQVVIGRISFIQTKLLPSSDTSNKKQWLFDLTELDPIGDGYYTDYSMIQRKLKNKQTIRNAYDVSPIAASFVRSENAYKIPRAVSTDNKNDVVDKNDPIFMPAIRQETYDLEDYPGPYGSSTEQMEDDDSGLYPKTDQSIIDNDKIRYDTIKGRLITSTIFTGVIGTLIAQYMYGFESSIIYFLGSLASIFYLLLLTLKTDTIAMSSFDASSLQLGASKFGNKIANLRFLMPVLLFIGIALYNQSLGDMNPAAYTTSNQDPDDGIMLNFSTITSNQYAAAIFGFLTYRIPLFLTQIQDAYQQMNNENDASSTTTLMDGTNSESMMLPGSAGIAMQFMKDKKASKNQQQGGGSATTETIPTVLLISGPQGTGRSELVQRFIKEHRNDDDNKQFSVPQMIDRIKDSVTFERIEQRNEFLYTDPTGRYGFTKQGIVNAAKSTSNAVVVIDADVTLAQKIVSNVGNIRVIGVWVGLNDVSQFETNIQNDITSGKIIIPPEETASSIIRARIKEIVQEIEYGISSGIFEFTIINTNEDDSLKQLREAASYCFL